LWAEIQVLKLRIQTDCIIRNSQKFGKKNGGIFYPHLKTVLNTYCEQEGIVEETLEQVIFQDSAVDSSSSSSDSSKSGVLLGVDELLQMHN
jgi:hypothetical protein